MLQKLDRTQFDKIYEIMELSFPIDEHRPYSEQLALFENPVYEIYTLNDSGTNQILGFIAIWEFDEIVFVEHFAVNPECRNGGIGSRILKELGELLNKRMCLEVELPESDITKRRIGFYERNGFFLNEYPYVQPALSKGQGEVPLLIMTTGGKVSEEEFVEIKNVLYRDVYQKTCKNTPASK